MASRMASMAAWCAGNAARFPGAWPAPGVRGCRSFCVVDPRSLGNFPPVVPSQRPGCAAHRCELRILYAKYAYLFLGQPAKCEVVPALTLPTTAPMTDNALKQRAAQKLATDWKPAHEFLPRLEGSIANHLQK